MEVFLPLAKFDSEQRLVYGYASTEARDSQGEIVTRAAIEAALPAYMEFANIREMHQLSAVGVVKSAGLDDKGLLLEAKVVDDAAWAKVREGVYKGLSIGGRVTQRDALNKAIITGVELNEISLVDRPANPEALIAAYKAAGAEDVADRIAKAASLEKLGARNSQADLERIQAMHDTSVELGAQCKGHDASGDADQDDSDGGDAGNDGDDDMFEAVSRHRRGDMLAKLARLSSRIEALSKQVEEQADLLQKIADTPAMPKYLAAHAVEKSADGAPAVDDAPKTALDAIKKAHRNPLRLSLG
ncbi:MAG TPA: XkdF-like putative serine protease domain-containing protein [Stellaceae bacterium]|jgi:HK97 family phage prohead protease|nr:XkdF-like putative serine protease domain-containing protein [Stellaceae bacterium]